MIASPTPLARLATYINGRPFKPEDFTPDGLPVVRIKQLLDPEEQCDMYNGPVESSVILRDGDLVFSWSGSLAVRRWDRGKAILNQHLFRVIEEPGVDRSWLRWGLESAIGTLQGAMHGSAMTHITRRVLKDVMLSVPSLDRQRSVARYLDRETARIDALIDKKRSLVAALLEAQPVVASITLLRTIDGPGALHARFPDGWKRVPFRWLFEEIDERSDDGSEELMSVSQTRGVIAQSELGDRHQYAETLAGYKICRKGDLVINRMWVYYGALGVAPSTGLVSPDYSVFRTRGGLSADFAAQILRTPAYVGEMTRLVKGVGAAFQGAVRKPRLHPRELGQIVMPVPPPGEQQELLRELRERTQAVRKRVGLVERSVALLLEKRQALIAQAISGQINVTEAA